MIKVVRESENTVKVTGDEKLYSIESAGIVVIAPMRPKSCQITFWTEEDWAKAVETEKKRIERKIQKQAKLQSVQSKNTEAKQE